jgi:hypothetical protein
VTKPGVNETVAVVAGGEQLEARVDEVGKDHVRLALAAKPATKLRREDDATLVFSGPRGKAELKGAVRRDGLSAGALRFDFEAPRQAIQRRRHVRVNAELPVLMRVEESGTPPIRTHTLNVSGGGVEVLDKVDVPLGAAVELELRLPGETTPIPIGGRVVRRARPHSKGVRIERMLASDQDRLIKFIFTRQRLELRGRRGA